MKLLLQSDWQADNMTAPVKQAIQLLKWKNETVEIAALYFANLSSVIRHNLQDYTPIGTVEFEGYTYNVSLLSNILFWKKKYARKGVQKHIDDLITIETGVRPEPKKLELSGLDLPF